MILGAHSLGEDDVYVSATIRAAINQPRDDDPSGYPRDQMFFACRALIVPVRDVTPLPLSYDAG